MSAIRTLCDNTVVFPLPFSLHGGQLRFLRFGQQLSTYIAVSRHRSVSSAKKVLTPFFALSLKARFLDCSSARDMLEVDYAVENIERGINE